MSDNPALMRMVFSPDPNNDRVYNLRGARLYEEMTDLTDIVTTHVFKDGVLDVYKMKEMPSVPNMFFLSPCGEPGIVQFMQYRRNMDRIIIDVTGPVLWLDKMDPSMNPREVIDYWSDPEHQKYGRYAIRHADAVMVNHSSLVDMIIDINPNVFLVTDYLGFEDEDTEDDSSDLEMIQETIRFTSDITRVIQSARSSCRLCVIAAEEEGQNNAHPEH